MLRNWCFPEQSNREVLRFRNGTMSVPSCPESNLFNMYNFCGGSASLVRGLVSRIIDMNDENFNDTKDLQCARENNITDVRDFTSCNRSQPHL